MFFPKKSRNIFYIKTLAYKNIYDRMTLTHFRDG